MSNALTNIEGFTIRTATEEDIPLILRYILELADYEGCKHLVQATEESLMESLFVKNQAETLIAEYCGEPVGFSMYLFKFSTFLGKAYIYLEDLYVTPQWRGKGFGKALLINLMKIAVSNDCTRLDWGCFVYNEPSMAFYKQLGARELTEWADFRVDGELLQKYGQSV
ncbi:GNAT family N-acetyltransferase [Aminipila terrae]|uniref:GNAT family N-acetyltransferase n=1 Tax=Aminipila terrae TaxID=2697030 RepID=A0A6P1MIV8_9FIRM|nr:GNAT family N-acetyltransferase [Aminipila terrae]QHI70995.1 GNAT family N-acetyltransferase [Aminipila terrae]